MILSMMIDSFHYWLFIYWLQVSDEAALDRVELAQSAQFCMFPIYLRPLRLLVVRSNLKFISAIFTESKILQVLTPVLWSTDVELTMLTMWSTLLPNIQLNQKTLKQKVCVVSVCCAWDDSRVVEMENTQCNVFHRLENILVLSCQEKKIKWNCRLLQAITELFYFYFFLFCGEL